MSGNLNINVTNVEAAVPREPIPMNGWFKSIIVKSEVVPSKSEPETGRRLNLELKVIEGPYANRLFWDGLNIVHSNPVTQEIAMKTLSAIGHATGVLLIQDSSQLHNIPMWVKIKLVPPVDKYEEKNEVVGYKHASEKVDPPKPAVSNGPTTGPASPAAGAAPFVPPTQPFIPPASAQPAQAPAWAPPAAQQPWAQTAQAPVQQVQAPVQQPVLNAPAPATQAQPAQTAPVQQIAQLTQQAPIDPNTGLAVPPWAVQQTPAA